MWEGNGQLDRSGGRTQGVLATMFRSREVGGKRQGVEVVRS